jgi:hypothetical protein
MFLLKTHCEYLNLTKEVIMFLRATVFIFLFLMFNSVSFSAPISSQFGLEVEVQDNATDNYYATFYEESSLNHTYSSGTTYADLSTGQTGTSTGSPAFVTKMFDTLTFDIGLSSSADVSFSVSYDGLVSRTSSYSSNPGSDYYLRIYDITGIDEWLDQSSFAGLYDHTSVVDDAPLVFFDYISLSFTDIDGGVSDGTAYYLSGNFSGTLSVESGHTYGIYIGSYTGGGRYGYADFFNTGAFEFTDLNGATFSSGSGVFLSESNPVPVPAAVLLLGSGLVGLLGIRRKLSVQF